jgi:hypothetical protein
MKSCSQVLRLLLAAPILFIAQPAAAQGAAPSSAVSRAQVKMERDEFMKTHRWDEASDTYVLRSGVEPPMGVKSRAEVKAERDAFLSKHRWDQPTARWIPLDGAPRAMNNVSRAQVKAETAQFLRTHQWSETSGTYVERPSRKPRS